MFFGAEGEALMKLERTGRSLLESEHEHSGQQGVGGERLVNEPLLISRRDENGSVRLVDLGRSDSPCGHDFLLCCVFELCFGLGLVIFEARPSQKRRCDLGTDLCFYLAYACPARHDGGDSQPSAVAPAFQNPIYCACDLSHLDVSNSILFAYRRPLCLLSTPVCALESSLPRQDR